MVARPNQLDPERQLRRLQVLARRADRRTVRGRRREPARDEQLRQLIAVRRRLAG